MDYFLKMDNSVEIPKISLAQPRGFCAGVVRAIEIVEKALATFPIPIYVYHEIVHNRHVVERLRKQGAIFVDNIDDIPVGAVCIFSAHGVAQQVVEDAQGKNLHIIDATCPLVTKIHKRAKRYIEQGYELIIIGHNGHPEVEGTRGQVPSDKVHVISTEAEALKLSVKTPDKLAYVTQTTLSTDDTRGVISHLQARFPKIEGPDLNDICYATQNRQNAVAKLAKQVDIILIVGAANSSNSNRLREVGSQFSKPAYLIDDYNDLNSAWFYDGCHVGISAGASAPERLVQKVIEYLSKQGITQVSTLEGQAENTSFKLPDIRIKSA